MSKNKKKPLTAIEIKRVAILKDALSQIKLKAYDVQAATGYVNQNNGSNLDNEIEKIAEVCEIIENKPADKVEFNKYFDKFINKQKPCQVCAKGALFLSTVRKFNNLSLQEAKGYDSLDSLARNGSKIADIFGKANIDKMEEYFEEDDLQLNKKGEEYDHWDANHNEDDFKKWSYQYPDDTDRLVAIIKNAIKNRGTFKPVLKF